MKKILTAMLVVFIIFVVGFIGLAFAVGEDPGVVEQENAQINEEAEQKRLEQKLEDDKQKAARAEERKREAELKQEQAKAIAEMEASRISFEEFSKIEVGMSKDQVVDIIGGPLELLSQSGSAEMYTVEGNGSLGANATFMFYEDRLDTKAQFGLE